MEKRNEPEWNAENINKHRGDTDFEICGWCNHRGCGSYRYDCMLAGYCNLLKDHRNEVEWNTKCIVTTLAKVDIMSIINSKRYEIEECENSIKDRCAEINLLKKIHRKALKSPPLAESRPFDYYNENDIIYVFHDNKWCRGVVVIGYRHHDCCVSYVLDDYPDSQAERKGPWGSGTGHPSILKEWEYLHFKEHMDIFKTWLALQDKAYNGKFIPLEDYTKAMEQ